MAAEINPVGNPVDYRPWFHAVSSGDWFKAKEFLTLHPSAITATDSYRDTALHTAAVNGHEQIVEELVRLMTEEQLETKNDDGETALTIAAAKNLKMVECLVAKNKKLLGIADDHGRTPILFAANHDRWDIVEELVQLMTEEQLEIKNNAGETALTIAAAKNLEVVECLVAKNKKLLGIANGRGRTPIFFAAKHDRWDIVEELVQLMTEEQLEIQDVVGQTALTIAAATNIKMVECLVAKNKKLLGIADSDQMTPILIAAKNHRWDIVRYLYSLTPLEDLKPDKGPCGSELVNYCLQAKQFDIAWDLLGRCPSLSCTKGLTRCPIYEYALLPFEFRSGTSFKFWQRWIYKCIHIKHGLSVEDVRINVQNQENEQGDQKNSTDLGLLQGLPSRFSKFLGINHIRELKLHHVRSREILDLIKDLNNKEMTANHELGDTVLLAAQNGIVELVTTLCRAKPELMDMEGRGGKSIFHHAVECRQENVYSLIYRTGKRNYFATLKDIFGKRMLDYAGMLSPLEKLDGIAGAALQM